MDIPLVYSGYLVKYVKPAYNMTYNNKLRSKITLQNSCYVINLKLYTYVLHGATIVFTLQIFLVSKGGEHH